MSNPVTLDPAFVAAKVAAVAAIFQQIRELTADQIEACVGMMRNTRTADRILERETAERGQARAALAAVGLLQLADQAIASAYAAIPIGLSSNYLAPHATSHWIERAILGVCLEGLPVTDPHLVPRLRNAWLGVTGQKTL